MSQLDLSFVRPQFPALALLDAGRPAVYFDGPGGTQVPQRVIDAMTHYLVHTNANHGGAFRTSRESDAILAAATRPWPTCSMPLPRRNRLRRKHDHAHLCVQPRNGRELRPAMRSWSPGSTMTPTARPGSRWLKRAWSSKRSTSTPPTAPCASMILQSKLNERDEGRRRRLRLQCRRHDQPDRRHRTHGA